MIKITDAELRARVQWIHHTTPHFEISYDKICLHTVEIEMLAQVLESAYGSIFSLTHEGITERFPIYLTDLRSPSLMGRRTSTHFSGGERAIYLVRNSHESLDTELIAMLTHAMRFPRYIKHYGITRGWALMEDAFATFLSGRLHGNPKHAYPFYGVEPDIIAHYLKEHAVLPKLFYSWHSLRFASELERRVLAGAFLLYLGDTASDDRVVEFSKYDNEITADTFRVFFSKNLEELEDHWSEHLPKSLLSNTETEYREMMEYWKKMMSWRTI
ncbi:MAG: hypothetical protein Q8896_12320 [Bacteroidota bacterium]|nr:hypothetical protein [Bacteroidota bacterium]